MSASPRVDILMYHSISEGGGPVAISPNIFAMQMAVLAESGVPSIDLGRFMQLRAANELPPRAVILTFDDGYEDFAEVAWPILRRHSLPAIVYLPTAKLGEMADWAGAPQPARRLMSWETIADLARAGVSFGSHTRTHKRLKRLYDEELCDELKVSRAEIEQRLGQAAPHFAPPYGAADETAQREIALNYETCVGTQFSRAGPDNDPLNLPRIEMLYYCKEQRWRDHLSGHGRVYFSMRKALRNTRQLFAG